MLIILGNIGNLWYNYRDMKKIAKKYTEVALRFAKARPYYFGIALVVFLAALVGTGFALRGPSDEVQHEKISQTQPLSEVSPSTATATQQNDQTAEAATPQPTNNASTQTPKAKSAPKTTTPEPAKTLVFNKTHFVIKAGEESHDILTVRASNGEAINMPMGNAGPVNVVYRVAENGKKMEWPVGLISSGFNPVPGTYTLPVRASGADGFINGTITVQVVVPPSVTVQPSQSQGPTPTSRHLYVVLVPEGGYTGAFFPPKVRTVTPGLSCELGSFDGARTYRYFCTVPAAGNYDVAIQSSGGRITRETVYTLNY